MLGRIIPFAFILATHLFGTVNCGHKHVFLFPPVIENIVHHKHTFLNSPDTDQNHGDFDVIGHSGGAEWNYMQDGANEVSSHNLGTFYGGGHGRDWLKASYRNRDNNIHGFGNDHTFGSSIKEVNVVDDFGIDNVWSMPSFNNR